MPVAQAPVPRDRGTATPPALQDFARTLHQGLGGWLAAGLEQTEAALEHAIQTTVAPADRLRMAELRARLHAQRQVWLHSLAQAIGRAVDDELQGVDVRPRAAVDPMQTLSLLDEDSIDEDIALSRLVQVAELEAEGTLRDLAALCSQLRGLASVRPDAHPMRPAVVARGLRQGVGGLELDATQRLNLLRHLAPAIGARLAPVYGRQAALLSQWGVQPTRFVARDLPRHAGCDEAGADADVDDGPLRTAVFGRMPASAAPRQLAEDALRRLVPMVESLGPAFAVPAGPAASGLPPAEVMARLLSILHSRTGLTAGTRTLLQRLDAPARRLAATEADLWRSPDHPLWLLLDRLIAAGAVLDDVDFTQAGGPGAELEAAVCRLEQAESPDPGELQVALTAIDGAASDLLDAEAEQLAPQAVEMQARLARDEIESRVREQILQQLRGTPVPAGLHQFLVGPWTTALAHSAHGHGFDSRQFDVQADLVQTLVDTCQRPRDRALPADVYTRCMTHARLGLIEAGLAAARIEAELADLGRTLRRPWADARHALADTDDATAPQAAADADAGTDAAPGVDGPAGHSGERDPSNPPPSDMLGLHEALATVPIDMGPDPQAAQRAQAACESWLDTLEPGTLYRLFIQGRWTNAQLVWRSLDRSMFVFSGRQAGIRHSMTRANLHKLRAAGLAAAIERGQFIAQALGEVARAAA